MVMIERGVELARRGDLDGAAVQYQKAIDSGHPLAVAEAGIKLGIVRDKAGDKASAMSAFSAAMATGHPERAPVAALICQAELARLDRFDLVLAAELFQRAIDSGDSDLAPEGMIGLARLLETNAPDTAVGLYQRAIDSRSRSRTIGSRTSSTRTICRST